MPYIQKQQNSKNDKIGKKNVEYISNSS